jgi:uncharacterized OB-fold protein
MGEIKTGEIKTTQEKWDITYNHSLGETASYFFEQLRDNKKIYGKKCNSCERVLLPPRSYCDRCFVDTEDWVEVGLEGRVETFTVVFQKFDGLPDPPYCIAYVLLDGADTAILNYVKGIDFTPDNVPTSIKMGDHVKVVFNPSAEGKITDFWYEKI